MLGAASPRVHSGQKRRLAAAVAGRSAGGVFLRSLVSSVRLASQAESGGVECESVRSQWSGSVRVCVCVCVCVCVSGEWDVSVRESAVAVRLSSSVDCLSVCVCVSIR